MDSHYQEAPAHPPGNRYIELSETEKAWLTSPLPKQPVELKNKEWIPWPTCEPRKRRKKGNDDPNLDFNTNAEDMKK